VFNITDRRARVLYQRELLIIMRRLENSQARGLKTSLNSQYLKAARVVEQGIDDIDYVIDSYKDKMVKQFIAYLRRAGTIFSKKTFKELPKKSMEDDFWFGYNAWMTAHAAKNITKISKTTKKEIAKVIQLGADENLTRKEIAKKIRKHGAVINPFRAITIAKTEMHTASVKAINDSVEATRIDFKREWIATADESTREDHSEADGQTVAMDDEFFVGGEGLKFPGDPSGSAENIINCRCVIGYLSA